MIANANNDLKQKIKDDLLRYNEGRGIMTIKEVADYYKMKPERVSKALEPYPYYEGRAHRYYVFDIAEAMCSELSTKNNKNQYLDTELRKAV